MSKSGKTSPVSIVDKNGKQTTVHRRATSSLVPDSSLLLPPSLQSARDSRKAQEDAIAMAAYQANKEAGYHLVEEEEVWRSMNEATEAEVELIAGAVHLDGFKEILVNAVIAPDDTASIGAVYDPDIVLEGSVNRRITSYCVAIKAAHVYMRGPIETVWQLSEEKDTTRALAKRYVAVYCAVNSDGLHKPTNDVADLALNASEDDYASILRVLREDSAATMEQINFVLEGGPSAISGGAL